MLTLILYDEDYEPEPIVGNTDAWSGEDEDEAIKDNWEDSDDADESKPAPVQTVKKKPLRERIAEKEAKRKAELEEKRRKEEEARQNMTPEEMAAEKLRLKLQEEEEQLMLAKELVGVTVTPASGLDAMRPSTTEEFTDFAKKLKNKISESEQHPLYTKFLEDLFRDLCVSLSSESIKKIGSSLTTLANEKQKQEKAKDGGKSKKKGKGPAIKQVRANDFDEGEYDEFEDFM
ncbi:EIF3J [Bugula neritina]|uniref:Eukaryotic translation initiation factor 3 subunit J n=1 Tax=Bugula neritina TaxID=10212 RepID=A0A7J7ITU7_BUGNE|nr:EIF3J [Bugula neritina]